MADHRDWECPRCTATARTSASDPRAPMHDCTGLAMLSVPMVKAGEHADVRVIEREDYVGDEDVRHDAAGRPIMRTEVEHADGHVDVWVYAPTAHSGARAG
jgi:hypothetical protein